jgi:sialate O-acetylesterase
MLRPLVLLLAFAGLTWADVRLPAVIGSNMVLQREQPLPIWGWADAGEEVTVALGENKATTKADDAGKWMVKLAPMKSGGEPLEMTVAGKNSIKLTNILVGEVWLGSGQSNMQMTVSGSANGPQEVAAANFPKIRLFSVPLVPSGTPAGDVVSSWKECSPANISGFSAVAYYFGRELHQNLDGVPIGLINSSWGGTKIEPWIPPAGFASQSELSRERDIVQQARANYQKTLLAGASQLRAWLAAVDQAKGAGQDIPDPPTFPAHPLNSNGAPTGLYNGMIHPLAPFALRGVLWYQGESNNGAGMHYHTLMKGLIQGWRTVWAQGDFPFLFVQLAPFRYGANETALAEIWEAQTATLSVPNTGMAVTTDISTVRDIHPPNKQDVGRRLALWALAKTYGKTGVVHSGPLYESSSIELDEVLIKFQHAEGGLVSRDKNPLTWFTIAGEDKKFHPATATIVGSEVKVRSPMVSAPVAVRFGWNQIAEPNLANKAGLPASPFRTDKWDDSAVPTFPGEKK